jgi:hypothetical protein
VYLRIFLKAAVNFALSFLRIVTLHGKLLENFDTSIKCTFLKIRQVGDWSLKILFIPGINVIYRWICFKFSWLLLMESFNKSIFWHRTGRISNCLKRLLHEAESCIPAIILMIFVCKMKIFPLLEELSQKLFHIL